MCSTHRPRPAARCWILIPYLVLLLVSWVVETLNDTVDDELAALPVDVRARFVRIAELIEAVGVPNVGEPRETSQRVCGRSA